MYLPDLAATARRAVALRLPATLATLCFAVLAGCGGGGGGGGAGALALPAALAPPASTATLSGTITNAAGQPVAGVAISAYHHNTHDTLSATTDTAGHYQIANLPAGTNADYAVYADKAGLAFQPEVSDAAGSVTRFDFNGLYRTVIRFETLPARAVNGANFTAYAAGERLASLARTGAATSFAPGDDAASARGVAWPAPRLADNGDGTVADKLTGLVWMKNAGCFAATDWNAALDAARKLASGACGLSDGSRAGDWRLPNVNELESLVDAGHAAPALPSGAPFTNVAQASAYWSSTTYTALPMNAMAIRFTDGRWINGINNATYGFGNDKAQSRNGLWAVRSGSAGLVKLLATGVYSGVGGTSYGAGDDASLQLGVMLTSPRFVDNGNGTLSDTVTGLVWLKQADCIGGSWSDALAAAGKLASGQCGLADGSRASQWRLPNRAEMLSLSDRAPTFPQASYFNGNYTPGAAGPNGPAVFANFIVSDYYWTSTTDAADTAQAWAVYSCDFGVYNSAKAKVLRALAVR